MAIVSYAAKRRCGGWRADNRCGEEVQLCGVLNAAT